MSIQNHSDSPHDALIKALEKVEDMDEVLVIYGGKNGTACGSFDSNMTVAQCLYLMKLFETWLMNTCLQGE